MKQWKTVSLRTDVFNKRIVTSKASLLGGDSETIKGNRKKGLKYVQWS